MSQGSEYYTLKLILSMPEALRRSLLKEEEIVVRGSPLDQHTRTLFKLQEKRGSPTLDDIGREHGAPAARAAYQHFYKMGAWSARNANVTTEDLMLPGGGQEIKGRLYRPAAAASDGLLVYLHGGGGAIGDIEAYDYFNKYLCEQLGAAVLFPDYGLGPERPYPAAPQDCMAVTRALPELSEKFGTNPENIIIGGDSMGGYLSTICGHEAGQAGVRLKALWLLFAAFDFENEYASLEVYKEGFGLSKAMMEWFSDQYFAGGGDRTEPLASPIKLPHLDRLPKTLLRAAEYDPLFDQSPAFREKVEPLGVDITYRIAKGLVHGYTNTFSIIPAAKKALDEDLDWLKAEFAR